MQPFPLKTFFCFKCGGFLAKVARHGVPDTARLAVVCVCQNSRCKTDNILHLDSGEITVKDAIQFHFEYPGIVEKIEMEEREGV